MALHPHHISLGKNSLYERIFQCSYKLSKLLVCWDLLYYYMFIILYIIIVGWDSINIYIYKFERTKENEKNRE